MKPIFGPETMQVGTVKSKIVNDTLEIVTKYQQDIAALNTWVASEKQRITNEYNKRYDSIVQLTEESLRKYKEVK